MNSMTQPRFLRSHRVQRKGAITVLAALMTVCMLAMVAFTVDVGYILSSEQELQRSADSAALAACWEYAKNRAYDNNQSDSINAGRLVAAQYAGLNRIGGAATQIDANLNNSTTGDITYGRIDDLYTSDPTVDTYSVKDFNAVTVRIRKSEDINGKVPLFFAKIFGLSGQEIRGEATAAYTAGVAGLSVPGHGGNIELLPFALDEDTWLDLLAGYAPDDWAWDSETGAISQGTDGILEVNLYPQGTGSPGNRGTVDIGGSNNSTQDIARQILYGISPADMAYHNDVLEFDANGELELNGDTGISAGVKDELKAIKGQPRVIPIFSKVHGPGNNAQFTIVKWAGVRILDVKLTGPMNKKRVIVQPAPIVVEGVIPGKDDDSDYVYSPVVLVN